MSDPQLRLIDNNIRVHTARAEANRLTAQHFLELAEADVEQAERWTDVKRVHLGGVALGNVIAFPGVEL